MAGVVSWALGKGKAKRKQATPARRRLSWQTKFLLWFLPMSVVWYLTDAVTAFALLATAAVFYWLARFLLWRRYWIKTLAADGLPDPGIVALRRQVKEARKRQAMVLAQFELAVMNNQKLLGTTPAKERRMPPVREVTLTSDGNVAALVDMAAVGKTVEDLQTAAQAIAGVCRANQFVVRRRSPGLAHVTWQFTDPLHTVMKFQELELPTKPLRVVIGRDELGRPMEVPLLKPLMLAGEQGSGKSVWAWDYLGSLIQQNIWVILYVIDPKGGMELGRLGDHVGEWMGRLKVAAFADSYEAGLEVMRQAREFMDHRSMELARDRVRALTTFTQERPLVVLLIDESLDFAKEMRDSSSDLQKYLRKARAAGGTSLAILQYGHASETGTARKLYGGRACGRAETDTATTIFGAAAVERGADTSRIPMGLPGVGFYGDDEGNLIRFRGAWATDEIVDRLCVGQLPDDMGLGQMGPVTFEHCVYVLPNRPGECLYVGETNDWDARRAQHAADKPWWGEVDVKHIRLIWVHGSTAAEAKAKALKLEAQLTAKFHPLYPVENNTDNPMRHDWRNGELAENRPPIIEPKQLENVQPARPSRRRKPRTAPTPDEPVLEEVVTGPVLINGHHQDWQGGE